MSRCWSRRGPSCQCWTAHLNSSNCRKRWLISKRDGRGAKWCCGCGSHGDFLPPPCLPGEVKDAPFLVPLQHDGMHVPSVIRLLAMHRAAVAVEALVGIGVDADVVDHQDAGAFQPHPDKAAEVEHRMAVARRGNE